MLDLRMASWQEVRARGRDILCSGLENLAVSSWLIGIAAYAYVNSPSMKAFFINEALPVLSAFTSPVVLRASCHRQTRPVVAPRLSPEILRSRVHLSHWLILLTR